MDDQSYFKFTTKSRLDKSVNSLLGIIEGISIDSQINTQELDYLVAWVNEHDDVKGSHPFLVILELPDVELT